MELMGAQDPTKLSVLNKEEDKVGTGGSRLLPRSATKVKRSCPSVSIPCKPRVRSTGYLPRQSPKGRSVPHSFRVRHSLVYQTCMLYTLRIEKRLRLFFP